MAPQKRDERDDFAEDTPTRGRACEMHLARMSAMDRELSGIREAIAEHQRALRGHNGDVGLEARMKRIEELFAEAQSHRKWLIGILVAAIVNIAIAVVPLLYR